MHKLKLTVLFLFTFLLAQSQTKNFIDQPFIEVNGTSDTLVTPNEIFIKIVLNERDTKDKISIEELEMKMYNALKAEGINLDSNLTTSDIASNFKYYLIRGKNVMKSKQYILKVGDATTASKVFISLENIGISNTSIDRVSHSDLEYLAMQMRTKAVINAKIRARALADPLNQTIGSAIHISNLENNTVRSSLYGNLEEVVVLGYSNRKPSTPELPKIEFEKIRIESNVSVKFILNP